MRLFNSSGDKIAVTLRLVGIEPLEQEEVDEEAMEENGSMGKNLHLIFFYFFFLNIRRSLQ